MDIQALGRLLLVVGLVLAIVGGIFWFAGRYLNLGFLPGDIRVEGQNFSCFVPIVSMIVLSVVLSIVLNIIIRIINRP